MTDLDPIHVRHRVAFATKMLLGVEGPDGTRREMVGERIDAAAQLRSHRNRDRRGVEMGGDGGGQHGDTFGSGGPVFRPH